jgi:hypothetical protein
MNMRRAITGEGVGALPLVGNCGGASVVHFGSLRGLNQYKDYDNVIIIGRNQPPVNALEEMAAGLFYDDEAAITFTEPKGDYHGLLQGRRGYRMREGLEDTNIQYHPDRRVQKVLEQIREAESGQAIDRLRMVWAREDGSIPNVYILSSVPLDVTVDKAVSWKEFQKIQSLWEESEGILPLNPKDLVKVAPNAAGSKSTAKRMITSFIEAESLLGSFIPEDFAMYRYKATSHRGKDYALYAAKGMELSRSFLGDYLGLEIVELKQLR